MRLTRPRSLTRICLLGLSGAAIMAMQPAASDAHTLSISRAQNAAAERVGQLKVDLTWPFDPGRFRQAWGTHTRHGKHILELRVILTAPNKQCTETLGPPTESGETEGPFCEDKPVVSCFRIGVVYPSKTLRKDPRVQDLWDRKRELIVGRPKRIDCPKTRSRGRSPGRGVPRSPGVS